MLDARRRRTPGRETEKPAPGINSRTEDRKQKTEDRLPGYQKIRVQVIRTAGCQVKNKRAGSICSCQPFGQM